MKKTMFTLVLGFLALNLSFAGQADLFSYDSDAIDKNLQALEELEVFVASNPDVTLSDLQAHQNALVNDLNLANNSSGMSLNLSGEPALGIGGFWWGCVLNWVGILVVYLVAEDPAETKKALWGCIVNSLVVGVSWTVPGIITGTYYGLNGCYY
jgi:hypothetical protein